MDIELRTPKAHDLAAIVETVGEWHVEAGPFQLHPGDIGWFGWRGDDVTAAALRTWYQADRLVAVGLLDGTELLRLALAPDAFDDVDLAGAMADDIAHEDARVLPVGEVDVEAPSGAVLRESLSAKGWTLGDAWTHLRRDLSQPVEVPPGLRVETVSEASAEVRTAVHRAAFGLGGFTRERWLAVASGPAYRRARCLVGYDGGDPVAAITVWSAGEGRPGIVEPMGVDPAHRGQHHGTAISLAGAAALRDLGASSARVGTPSDNTAAIATYAGAGFAPWAEVTDLRRAAGQEDTGAPTE